MTVFIVIAVLLLFSVVSGKFLYKFGVPVLIIFLGIGMLLGEGGIGRVSFADPELAKQIVGLCLAYITFSGGFGTNWKAAKGTSKLALTLASGGVLLTALFIALFAVVLIPGFTFLEGLLVGSIIASTDVASVFSILRSRRLNLKHSLGSLLELESGSNDPTAYILMIVILSIMTGETVTLWYMIPLQIFGSLVLGFVFSKGAVWLVNKIDLELDGMYSILLIAIILFTYASAELVLANGFLAVYVLGIVLGNTRLAHKVSLVRYFDGFGWLMQIILFFTLGLLVVPAELPAAAIDGIAISLFLIFVARPLAVILLMSLFKRPIKEQLFVAWVGFRGASSIVFASFPLALGLPLSELIFNVVFFVATLTVVIQGTLLVPIAHWLKVVSPDENILLTFTDYSGDYHTEVMEIVIPESSVIANKSIMDIAVPEHVLFVLIKRGNQIITPRGSTKLKTGDTVLIAGDNIEQLKQMQEWADRKLRLPSII